VRLTLFINNNRYKKIIKQQIEKLKEMNWGLPRMISVPDDCVWEIREFIMGKDKAVNLYEKLVKSKKVRKN